MAPGRSCTPHCESEYESISYCHREAFKRCQGGGSWSGRSSWIGQNRRMSKDYERLPGSGEAFIYVAMSRLMVKRSARS